MPAGEALAIRPLSDRSLSGLLFGADEMVGVTARVRAPMPERRHALVEAAERGLGETGEVSDSGPARFVWKGAGTLVRDTVTVEREGAETSIEVRSDRTGRYLLFWGISFVVLATAAASLEAFHPMGALNPVLTLVLPAFLPVVAGRPFWRRAQDRARDRLERLGAELARLIDDDPATHPGGGADEAHGR